MRVHSYSYVLLYSDVDAVHVSRWLSVQKANKNEQKVTVTASSRPHAMLRFNPNQ